MSAAEVLRDTHATLDVARIREDFPILREQVHDFSILRDDIFSPIL